MVRCAIFGCNSDPQCKNFESGTSFFRFPKDKVLRNIWKTKCYRNDEFNTENSRICSKHFDSNKDYSRNLKYQLLGIPLPPRIRKLNPDAVPTLNLPVTSSAVASVGAANERAERKRKREHAKLIHTILESTLSEPK